MRLLASPFGQGFTHRALTLTHGALTLSQNNDNTKRYQLRKKLKIDVPRFNTNYMRNSVARRGAIGWNTLVPQLNDDIDNVKKYAVII